MFCTNIKQPTSFNLRLFILKENAQLLFNVISFENIKLSFFIKMSSIYHSIQCILYFYPQISKNNFYKIFTYFDDEHVCETYRQSGKRRGHKWPVLNPLVTFVVHQIMITLHQLIQLLHFRCNKNKHVIKIEVIRQLFGCGRQQTAYLTLLSRRVITEIYLIDQSHQLN